LINTGICTSPRIIVHSTSSWAHGPSLPTKAPGSSELHTVYANPGTIAAYRTSGHFPDGTVLIKEVYETSTAPMTTGTVSQARNLKGWFVMVKDSHDSYPANPLWGDGWGWVWFNAENP
jgi:Cytochrome P460